MHWKDVKHFRLKNLCKKLFFTIWKYWKAVFLIQLINANEIQVWSLDSLILFHLTKVNKRGKLFNVFLKFVTAWNTGVCCVSIELTQFNILALRAFREYSLVAVEHFLHTGILIYSRKQCLNIIYQALGSWICASDIFRKYFEAC